MKKNVRIYICGIYLLIYSAISIAIFGASVEYLRLTFFLYSEVGFANNMRVAIVDGLMCLQLFTNLFSGLIALFAFVKNVSGKWLIVAGSLGIASKVLYVGVRIVSVINSDQLFSRNVVFGDFLDCCLPLAYLPFCVAVLIIGIWKMKNDRNKRIVKWFPFVNIMRKFI